MSRLDDASPRRVVETRHFDCEETSAAIPIFRDPNGRAGDIYTREPANLRAVGFDTVIAIPGKRLEVSVALIGGVAISPAPFRP